MNEIIKQAFNRIEEAHVVSEPFDHLIIDNLLPDDFYKKLSQDLSGEDFYSGYTRGGYGNKERFGVDITDYDTWNRSKNKSIPTAIHKKNYETLSTKGSKNIKVFFDLLLQNQQALYSLLCSKLQTEKAQDKYFFHVSMTKDIAGYKIEKHTDSEENIFTILFFAPENNINKEFGLHVYKDAGSELGAKFLDFIPNRMIAFAPCSPNKSRTPTWHEVKHLTEKLVGTRNSFQVFFYGSKA